MMVRIELLVRRGRDPTKSDMDGNIKALKKVEDGEPLTRQDEILIADSVSILEALQRELPA